MVTANTRIINRQTLFDWIISNAPSLVRRAAERGHILLLGGFSSIPPSNSGGWIVQVTSHNGIKYIGAVLPCPRNTYKWMQITRVPWESYLANEQSSDLMKGDMFELGVEERRLRHAR
jgi:cytochrome b561